MIRQPFYFAHNLAVSYKLDQFIQQRVVVRQTGYHHMTNPNLRPLLSNSSSNARAFRPSLPLTFLQSSGRSALMSRSTRFV